MTVPTGVRIKIPLTETEVLQQSLNWFANICNGRDDEPGTVLVEITLAELRVARDVLKDWEKFA